MDELLAKATHGVDLDSPDAFVHIFINLMALMPWAALFWWSVLFVVVGALVGWWRGRTVEGIVWAVVLGPIGWFVVLARPRPTNRKPVPPPLPPRR
jgi:hypothetical protein